MSQYASANLTLKLSVEHAQLTHVHQEQVDILDPKINDSLGHVDRDILPALT